MKTIPPKFQVFDQPVDFDSKDIERLKVHLTGWNRLNEIFLLGVNEADLRRLVIIELATSARKAIISRLLGRLAKIERQKINARINKLHT